MILLAHKFVKEETKKTNRHLIELLGVEKEIDVWSICYNDNFHNENGW